MNSIIGQTEIRYCSNCDKYYTVTAGDCRLPSDFLFKGRCPRCRRPGETSLGRVVRKLAEKVWPF